MNICVTGGAGFIGSHLTDRLIALGHSVLVVDNLISGCREFVHEKADFVEMDIRDEGLCALFTEQHIEYVFHEAAQTMVDASMKDPKYDCDVNLVGLLNVLNACRDAGVKKVLLPSSAAVYGDNSHLPLTETEIGEASSFYGLSKLTTEGYLRIYQKTFGLPYICYRYSNVYGPRQGNGGEGGVVSIFCQAMVNNHGVTVFGDGEQTRDFVYVADVVEANIAGLRAESVTGIFNVSTNYGISVNSFIKELEEVAGSTLRVLYGEERAGDIKHSRLDTAKALEFLQWKAEIRFHEGLKKTYSYFEETQAK